MEREEEGWINRDVAGRDIIHGARQYHHETIKIGNMDDDI